MTFEIGEYQAIEKVGSGASADVWRGIRMATGSPVAIKVLRSVDLRLAQREATLAALVNHSHVPAVLDVVSDGGRVALVTEFAAGGSLADQLDTRRERGLGPLPGPQVLTLLLPIAGVLATAHGQQITHGDVSAENILFDGAGRPLLADLGAARAAADLALPVQTTPGDAAPELARGGTPNAASDLFALGSVALACLTGRHAWPAEDLRDVLIQSTAGQWPDPGEVAADSVLIAAIRGLLDPSPKRRPSAAGLIIDLRSAGDPEPIELLRRRPVDQGPDIVGSTRSRAVTVLRDPGQATGPDESPSTGSRRSGGEDSRARHRAGLRVRPASGSSGARARHRAVRLAVVALVGLLVIGASVRAGLWWSERDQTSSVAALAEPSEGAAVSLPVGVAARSTSTSTSTSTAGSTPSAPPGGSSGPISMSSRRTSTSSQTTGGSSRPVGPLLPVLPTEADSGAPSSSRSALPTAADSLTSLTSLTSVPSSGAPRPDWTVILTRLDQARGAALTKVDPRLLDAVYTPGSTARAADLKVIAGLQTAGYRLTGARHHIDSVTLLTASPQVELTVVDEMPAYSISDLDGREIGATPARGPATRVFVLTSTVSGYRISAVSST